MAEQIGSIYYDLNLDDSKFKKGVKSAQTDSKGLSDSLKKVEKASKALLVSLTAVAAGAVAFGVSSVKAFEESESQIAQTNAVLRSTGQIAGVTADQVTKLSKSLELSTAYSDEQVRSAENMALTFTGIKKDIFPQVTQTALDMAVALNHGVTPSGEEATDTMKLLGKALQDPDKGLGALHRVGVNVDELTKKFKGVNDIATKQKLILQELGTEFGGSASSAASTFAGRLKHMKEQFNDLQETVGEAILKALEPFMDWIGRLMRRMDNAGGFFKYFNDLLKKNKDLIIALGIAITLGLIPAFIGMAIEAAPFVLLIGTLVAVGALLAPLIDHLIQKMGGWKAVLKDVIGSVQYLVTGDFKKGLFDPSITKDSPLVEWLDKVRSFAEDAYSAIHQLLTGKITGGTLGSKKGAPLIDARGADQGPSSAIRAEAGSGNQPLDVPSDLQNNITQIRDIFIKIKDTITDIGSVAIPVLIKGVKDFYALLKPALDDIKNSFQSLLDTLTRVSGGTQGYKVVLVVFLATVLTPFAVLLGIITAAVYAYALMLRFLASVSNIVAEAGQLMGGMVGTAFRIIVGGGHLVADVFMEIYHAIEAVVDIFGKLVKTITNAPSSIGRTISGAWDKAFSGLKGLAVGGPAMANTPYLIGERGPELFIPDTPGRVVTASQTSSLLDNIGKGTVGMAPSQLSMEINLSGVLADSPAAKTQLGLDLITAVNRHLVAKGQPELGNGYVRGNL